LFKKLLRKKQSGIAFLPRYRFFTAAGIVDKNNDYSKSCCEKNRLQSVEWYRFFTAAGIGIGEIANIIRLEGEKK
jgi:hypothetical protein